MHERSCRESYGYRPLRTDARHDPLNAIALTSAFGHRPVAADTRVTVAGHHRAARAEERTRGGGTLTEARHHTSGATIGGRRSLPAALHLLWRQCVVSEHGAGY